MTVAGPSRSRALPSASDDAVTPDGYEVALRRAGDETVFTVSRDGAPVKDIQPYLGARGHLVALREGDPAYLHVHPTSAPTAGRDIRFLVEYPSSDRYRLFLQFRHAGRVQTAALTQQATDDGAKEMSHERGH